MKISLRRWLAGLAAATVVATGVIVAAALPAHAAVSSVRVVEIIWNAPNHTTSSATLQCNTGETVLSGGALVMSLNTGVRLIESFASSNTKWSLSVHNESNGPQEIRARALCATGVAGYERRWVTGFQLKPNTVTDLTVTCPSGKTSLAGGFQTVASPVDRDRLKASASFVSGTGWKATIRNDSIATYSGNVQAICTSMGRWWNQSTVTVTAGGTNVFTNHCGSSNWLVGGGWKTNENTPHNIVTAALPTDASNDYWKINLANPDSVSHSVQFLMICMEK